MGRQTTAPVVELVKALFGLSTLRRELDRHALAELGSQGFSALAAVHLSGPARMSDVAAQLNVDRSVASRQLSSLAAAGYVASEADSDDARAVRFTTTASGRRALKTSYRRMVDAFTGALDDWSEEELEALSAGLRRLAADFESEGR